jgi:hypothetical protein
MAARLGLLISAGLLLLVFLPSAVNAAGPQIERGGFVERYFDDFIYELCGIETYTTESQRWSVKVFPDGTEQVHVVRTFRSEDPRLPIEKGAATAFNYPDGTRTVVGKPIQLLEPDGGIRLIGAGWTHFGEDGVTIRGRDGLNVDLAEYYCP